MKAIATYVLIFCSRALSLRIFGLVKKENEYYYEEGRERDLHVLCKPISSRSMLTSYHIYLLAKLLLDPCDSDLRRRGDRLPLIPRPQHIVFVI